MKCEEFNETIYNSEWYTKPITVQKVLCLMLIGSQKIRQLDAFGLQKFSMNGLSEVKIYLYYNIQHKENVKIIFIVNTSY